MAKPVHIHIPQPIMGGKAWLLDQIGVFVLERGPGTLITVACTHAGAGSVKIIDGVPNDDGFFINPDDVPAAQPDFGVGPDVLEKWGKRNGREYYRPNPMVMGSWMMNAGFHNGLTVHVPGGHNSIAPVATIVWQPFRKRDV